MSVMHAQLFINMLRMFTHRCRSNTYLSGDCFLIVPTTDERQHFPLASGQSPVY